MPDAMTGPRPPVQDRTRARREGRASVRHPDRHVLPANLVLRPGDGPRVDGGGHAALPFVTRRRRHARRRLHYLFEGPGWTSLRLASDLLTALTAVILTTASTGSGQPVAPGHASLFAFPLAVVVMLHLRGMYRRRVRVVILDAIGPIVGAVSVAAMGILAYEVLVHQNAAVGSQLGRAWALTLLLLGGGRVVLAILQDRARAHGLVGKPTLIVGAGRVGAQVARRLEDHPEYGLRPAGFLDADPPDGLGDRTVPVLGSPDELAGVVRATRAEHVIFAFSRAPDHGLVPLMRRCDELGVEISLVPRLFESINDRMALDRLGGLPLLGLRAIDPQGWQFRLKYALDRPLAALMLIAVSPVLLAAVLAVKLTSPGPILFRQRRVGRDGQDFTLYKFRSMWMHEAAGEFRPPAGTAPGGVEGGDRRTRVGRVLRRSAIDELPQLLNVLKGEMSMIGPRPERPEFVEQFDRDHTRYADRHRVKSGITGWAQVHGLRGQTSLADRIEWDNFYIENWSLWLDLKVTLMTVGAVMRSGHDA